MRRYKHDKDEEDTEVDRSDRVMKREDKSCHALGLAYFERFKLAFAEWYVHGIAGRFLQCFAVLGFFPSTSSRVWGRQVIAACAFLLYFTLLGPQALRRASLARFAGQRHQTMQDDEVEDTTGKRTVARTTMAIIAQMMQMMTMILLLLVLLLVLKLLLIIIIILLIMMTLAAERRRDRQ